MFVLLSSTLLVPTFGPQRLVFNDQRASYIDQTTNHPSSTITKKPVEKDQTKGFRSIQKIATIDFLQISMQVGELQTVAVQLTFNIDFGERLEFIP